MPRVILAVLGLLIAACPVQAADALAEARRLYNAGRYESAAAAAREAMAIEALADAARVVFGRIQLERYRQSANPEDLAAARESLRSADPVPLRYHERLELSIGQAEVLYFDDRFGAAAELFESSLDRSVVLGPNAHERVLDWWATSLDRHAQSRPVEERGPVYTRVSERMRAELAADAGSSAASYWLAAAARGSGDLERAWQSAIAGWVRAGLAPDRGAALRGDLDRLVTLAIIPERAARLRVPNVPQVVAGMENEWQSFKAGWSK